jgi:hypothetical protein
VSSAGTSIPEPGGAGARAALGAASSSRSIW